MWAKCSTCQKHAGTRRSHLSDSAACACRDLLTRGKLSFPARQASLASCDATLGGSRRCRLSIAGSPFHAVSTDERRHAMNIQREEHDAKISALEARTEARVSRIEAVVLAMQEEIREIRKELRSSFLE